jgi:hypothetical protein
VQDNFEEFLITEKKSLSKQQLVNEFRDNYWD